MHRSIRITMNGKIAEPSKGEANNTRDHLRHNIGEKICFRCEGRSLYKKSDLQIHKLNFSVANYS